jgi:RecA-family ATPase
VAQDNSASLSLQTLARALSGEVTGGQVRCPGPNHSPQDRSLSVKLSDAAPDGFVTHSFAGDNVNACRDHVRVKAGLAPFKRNGQKQAATDEAIAQALEAAIQAQSLAPKRGVLVASYDYTDEQGELLYQVQRFEPKSFAVRRPDGDGKWTHGIGERRVLYRWPDLLQYPDGTVFLCEGEKDADNIAERGFCATCAAGGKWTPDMVQAIAGRDVLVMQDNDAAGEKKAQHAASLLHGVAASVRIVLLPGLPERGDVSDWLDLNRHNTEKLVELCFDVPVWEPDESAKPLEVSKQGDVQNNALVALSEAQQPVEIVEKSEDPPPKLTFVDVSKWHEHPPAREWSTLERFPLRQVCLLSGEGAVGKSIVMLQLCAAHVLGKDWLCAMPEPGPAIYLGAEDDATEMWRRMVPIAQHYGASMSELAGKFHALDFAGKNAVLAAPDRRGVVQTTPLFRQLREAACDIKPKLIGIDTSADVFAGEENDRSQVRQFIGLLRGLAIDASSTVLVCTHPSLTGINTGTGLSGSTAWHNSVRARAYLHPATTDPQLRELTFKKNNYGPIAERVMLRWKAGVFVPEPSTGSLEELAADRKTEELFLMLLARYAEQGRNVSDKPTAPTYAPTMFSKTFSQPQDTCRAIWQAVATSLKARQSDATRAKIMSVQLPCSYPYNMRAAACSYRGGHPPYTPSVLARTHARLSVACFVASPLSFLATRRPARAAPFEVAQREGRGPVT